MDFSKLPKLSETKPEPPPSDAARQLSYAQQPREFSVGAEVWLCFVVGIFLIVWCNRPLEYLYTRSHPDRFTWTFQDENQNPIGYLRSVFFLVDLGGWTLGLVMLFDGIQILLARSVRFVVLALVLTLAAILINVAAMVECFAHGSGFQILNFLAIVLGGYIAIYQWNAIKALRHFRQFQPAP